ncbi:MAG: FMN-binding protein [Spirochaetales bacterium]|nr:FMN-binding protein [Spirochaetales bacterium]
MKKTGFYAERIRPVLVTAVLTIICITSVSFLHLFTQDQVRANEGLVLKKAVLSAAGVTLPASNLEVNDLYEARVSEGEGLFTVRDEGGNIMAYAFIQAGPGLWGEIEAIVAFDSGFSHFAGTEFIKQNETPGLGARITESWFKEQLRGKKAPLSLNPEGTESTAESEIDGITGASRTSEYALSLFNRADERAAELKGRVQ